MSARDEDVPRYAYALAVVAGFGGLSFIFAASYFLAGDLLGYLVDGSPDGSDGDYGHVSEAAAIFIIAHALLGAIFGFLWPEKTWRWGVWLCALPALFAALLAPSASAFLIWVAVTLAPACIGAYAAGKAHLQFTAVDETG